MEPTTTCVVCRRSDVRRNLVLWLLYERRETVHLECWFRAHEAERTASGHGQREELQHTRPRR